MNGQLALPMPVEQDVLELDPLSEWDSMEAEYAVMGLHPASHVMAHLRRQLGKGVITSAELTGMKDGTRVTVAGWVIRRQHPLGNAVYVTLEDEYGHSPLVLWPKTYERLRAVFREPLVIVSGYVSCREGTMNVVVTGARKMPSIRVTPKSKDWR